MAEAADDALSAIDEGGSVSTVLYEDRLYGEVVARAIDRLRTDARGPAPSSAALPLWCAMPKVVAEMAQHWREVPLASGAPHQ